MYVIVMTDLQTDNQAVLGPFVDKEAGDKYYQEMPYGFAESVNARLCPVNAPLTYEQIKSVML